MLAQSKVVEGLCAREAVRTICWWGDFSRAAQGEWLYDRYSNEDSSRPINGHGPLTVVMVQELRRDAWGDELDSDIIDEIVCRPP